MTPDQFRAKHEDAVNDWINEGEIAGYANAKTDMQAMLVACGGDKAAAFQAVVDGKSIADARNERSQTLEEQLAAATARADAAEAKAKELDNGAEPLNLSADAQIDESPATEEDAKRDRVFGAAKDKKSDYARNAYIESCGYSVGEYKAWIKDND